jgi:hypothetical protein
MATIMVAWLGFFPDARLSSVETCRNPVSPATGFLRNEGFSAATRVRVRSTDMAAVETG